MRDSSVDKWRVLLVLVSFGSIFILVNFYLLSGTDVRSKIKSVSLALPGQDRFASGDSIQQPEKAFWHQDNEYFENHAAVKDDHPISGLMKEADEAWEIYDEERSKTFRETITKYRTKYGRHPPPGFKDWYRFARESNVFNIDDFGQIMDDLRPFWGLEPAIIRTLAAHMHEDPNNAISGLHIRDKKIWRLTNANWRTETFAEILKPFIKFLPNMDIAMNLLDQPRVVVPWDDMQELLSLEVASRQLYPDPSPQYSKNMLGHFTENDTKPMTIDPKFFSTPGRPYMPLAKEACPPWSRARNDSWNPTETWYKDVHGFVTNFNRSSDLCIIGPDVQSKHGFLFAPSSMVPSKKLLPIFGECKVNVNSDILFPANIYYMHDDRYAYDPTFDFDWDDKRDKMTWRGVTSGGVNTAENWREMHRQRLVFLTNGTYMADKEVRLLSEESNLRGAYRSFEHFNASSFALKHTDVGFTQGFSCVPENCSFYDNILTYKNITTLSEQFLSKFLVDVDGHSFSGRWHAFLRSKSLGIKSTIFREWHDSRVFAWRHFVPLDNRYEELYSILTYFIGLGSASTSVIDGNPYIPRHDFEARKLGRQGREWAEKVLRREDIEIYTFRLLLEYARVIDDNRHAIGYGGNGSELDKFDAKHLFP